MLTSEPNSRIDALPQAQRERLAFIEYRCFFCGELQRADIEARFGVKAAAATRDLIQYRLLAPHNLIYDGSAKVYVPTPAFQPLFPFDEARVLTWLTQGFGDGLNLKIRRPLQGDAVDSIGKPRLDTLAVLTRAIHQGRAVAVSYLSLSSGESDREIVPHSIVDNGLRWHIRAFDRTRRRFSDFVASRVVSAKMLDELPEDDEKALADAQWNRIVDLEFVPHPGLKHPEVIAKDFSMTDGVFRTQARAAVVGYALHKWQVDCTTNHSLNPNEHHLWLRNTPTLYGVESAVMGPGHKKEDLGQ